MREAPEMSLEVDVSYFVGLFPWQDAQETIYTIATGDVAAVAKHIYVGRHGPANPTDGSYSFDSLRKLGIRVEDVTEQAACRTGVCRIPYRIDRDKLHLVLGFNPPIDPHEERRIRIRMNRRELWDSLRSDGHDSDCAFTTAGIPTKRLRIRVVVPYSTISPDDLQIISDTDFAAVGKITRGYSAADQGPEAVWEILDPDPDTRYEYEVKCEPLAELGVRLGQMVHRIRKTLSH